MASKEAYLNVLCLATVLRALFEKYSINLFLVKEFPFDELHTYWIFMKTYKIYGHYPLQVSKGAFL